MLDPYADAELDAQGVKGFSTEFRSWDDPAGAGPLIPGRRGTVYLYAPGRWQVRIKTTDSAGAGGDVRIGFREVEAQSWTEVGFFVEGFDASQVHRAGQIVGIPTSGQTQILGCTDSVSAKRLDLWIDANQNLGVNGIWIGTGGQRAAVDGSLWLPISAPSAPYRIELDRWRLPIGVVRCRADGAAASLNYNLWSRAL